MSEHFQVSAKSPSKVLITPESVAGAIRELLDENDRLKRDLSAAKGTPTNRKKLTDREVKQLKEMHRAGTSQAELAEVFDIHPATVSRIVRGLYHK